MEFIAAISIMSICAAFGNLLLKVTERENWPAYCRPSEAEVSSAGVTFIIALIANVDFWTVYTVAQEVWLYTTNH